MLIISNDDRSAFFRANSLFFISERCCKMLGKLTIDGHVVFLLPEIWTKLGQIQKGYAKETFLYILWMMTWSKDKIKKYQGRGWKGEILIIYFTLFYCNLIDGMWCSVILSLYQISLYTCLHSLSKLPLQEYDISILLLRILYEIN